MSDLTDQVMNVEELPRLPRSEDRRALAEVMKLDAQHRNALGHLHTFCSKMPGL